MVSKVVENPPHTPNPPWMFERILEGEPNGFPLLAEAAS
jgi:hypothetical protein